MNKNANVSFGKRMKSCIIDLVFMIFLTAICVPIVGYVFLFISKLMGNELENKLLELVCMFICWVIYPVFMELLTSHGSLGKKLSKIKIIDAETGEKPTKKKLILRGLIFAFLLIFDVIVCRFNMEHLSLSDMITRTRVVPETFGESEFIET